jgi:hypothetical protein
MSEDDLIEEVAGRFLDILGLPISASGEQTEDALVHHAMEGKLIYINCNTKVICSLPNPIIKTKINSNERI